MKTIRPIRWLLVALVAAACAGAVTPRMAEALDRAREHEVKAAMLLNFARFVQWPESSFEDESSSLVIGVVGPNPFADALEITVEGEEVRGRPLEVRYAEGVDELEDVDLLYLASGAAVAPFQVAEQVDADALVVGDGVHWLEVGAHLALSVEEQRVRFHADVDAIQASRLWVSSQLLRLAKVHGDHRAAAAGR